MSRVGDGWTRGAGVLSGFCLLGLSALLCASAGWDTAGGWRGAGVLSGFVCWVCLHCLCVSVGGILAGGWDAGSGEDAGASSVVLFLHGTLSFFCL